MVLRFLGEHLVSRGFDRAAESHFGFQRIALKAIGVIIYLATLSAVTIILWDWMWFMFQHYGALTIGH